MNSPELNCSWNFPTHPQNGSLVGPNEPMSENSIVVSEAITFLNSMQSREEASSYFSTNDLKRVDLEAICKQLDLPFTKKENMKTLQEKIIEGTVGYKLRSQAIQK